MPKKKKTIVRGFNVEKRYDKPMRDVLPREIHWHESQHSFPRGRVGAVRANDERRIDENVTNVVVVVCGGRGRLHLARICKVKCPFSVDVCQLEAKVHRDALELFCLAEEQVVEVLAAHLTWTTDAYNQTAVFMQHRRSRSNQQHNRNSVMIRICARMAV